MKILPYRRGEMRTQGMHDILFELTYEEIRSLSLGLDWIVGPEYSFRVFSTWKMKKQPGTIKKTIKTNLEP